MQTKIARVRTKLARVQTKHMVTISNPRESCSRIAPVEEGSTCGSFHHRTSRQGARRQGSKREKVIRKCVPSRTKHRPCRPASRQRFGPPARSPPAPRHAHVWRAPGSFREGGHGSVKVAGKLHGGVCVRRNLASGKLREGAGGEVVCCWPASTQHLLQTGRTLPSSSFKPLQGTAEEH